MQSTFPLNSKTKENGVTLTCKCMQKWTNRDSLKVRADCLTCEYFRVRDGHISGAGRSCSQQCALLEHLGHTIADHSARTIDLFIAKCHVHCYANARLRQKQLLFLQIACNCQRHRVLLRLQMQKKFFNKLNIDRNEDKNKLNEKNF